MNASPAFADEEEDAKQAMIKGTELFEKKKYKDALTYYLQAMQLVPERSGPYREVAKCYQQLDNVTEALHYFTEYLRRKPDAPEKAEYEQAITRLQSKLASKNTTPLSVSSDPSGAAVYLVMSTGEARGIGFTPLKGVHVSSEIKTIRLLSAQHPARDKEIDLSGGSVSIEVSLIDAPAPNDTLDDPLPDVSPKPLTKEVPTLRPLERPAGRGLLIASIGAGVGALGAGAVFFVEKNNFDKIPANDLEQLDEVRARLFIEAGAADVLTATSVVLGGLWLIKRARGQKESALILSPSGVELVGAF